MKICADCGMQAACKVVQRCLQAHQKVVTHIMSTPKPTPDVETAERDLARALGAMVHREEQGRTARAIRNLIEAIIREADTP